ncbi:MAG: hypothetical protein ACLP1D_14020 [Xanthobacteraceae bacterium]
MDETARFDYYVNWTKTLVAEMNAAIACLHDTAIGLKAAQRQQAEQALAGLRKLRDDFQETFGKQKVSGDAAWNKVNVQVDSEWEAFETELSKNIKGFGGKVEERLKAILRHQAMAQQKAWREFADGLSATAAILSAKHRTESSDLLKHLSADAELAEQKLRELNEAGNQSLSALTLGLKDARAALGKA